MNNNENTKAKIQDLKSLRESAYKRARETILPEGIVVVSDDGEESTNTYAINRLIISVNKTDE